MRALENWALNKMTAQKRDQILKTAFVFLAPIESILCAGCYTLKKRAIGLRNQGGQRFSLRAISNTYSLHVPALYPILFVENSVLKKSVENKLSLSSRKDSSSVGKGRASCRTRGKGGNHRRPWRQLLAVQHGPILEGDSPLSLPRSQGQIQRLSQHSSPLCRTLPSFAKSSRICFPPISHHGGRVLPSRRTAEGEIPQLCGQLFHPSGD